MDRLGEIEIREILGIESERYQPIAKLENCDFPSLEFFEERPITQSEGLKKLLGEELHESAVSDFSWADTVGGSTSKFETDAVRDLAKCSSSPFKIRLETRAVDVDGVSENWTFGYDHTGQCVFNRPSYRYRGEE